jgi:hypothetical protein
VPADRPIATTYECQLRAALAAMQPYTNQARATWAGARRQYQAGLAPGRSMFVTARLTDSAGHVEQVFVAVDSIAGSRIVGRIWSQIAVVAGYRYGQRYELDESVIVDWMIANPDGSEDGNVVGKFLDSYHPPASCGEA